MGSKSITKEIESFDSFDDFSILPDNLETVVSSTDDSEGNENNKNVTTITVEEEEIDSNEPDSIKKTEPITMTITETEIENGTLSKQIAMKNETTKKIISPFYW